MTSQTNNYQIPAQRDDYRQQFLRRTVQADGVWCTMVGLGLAVGASSVASFLGLSGSTPAWVLGLLGAGTALYGLEVLYLATKESLLTRLSQGVIIGNILWVVASALLLFTTWITFSTSGWWAIAILADIVGLFAAVQIYALWQLDKE